MRWLRDYLQRLVLSPIPPVFYPNSMLTQLLINILLAILWHLLLPVWGAADYLIGFGVGAIALTIHKQTYGRRLWALITFAVFIVWEIIISNVKLAQIILQRQPKLAPAIVAVPLAVTSPLEITILASVITLTPGTLSIDLGKNESGERVLYVHSMAIEDIDEFRHSLKETFERKLLAITRGN